VSSFRGQGPGQVNGVAELTEANTVWAETWKLNPEPFIWKATAESIIEESSGTAEMH